MAQKVSPLISFSHSLENPLKFELMKENILVKSAPIFSKKNFLALLNKRSSGYVRIIFVVIHLSITYLFFFLIFVDIVCLNI